MLDFCLEFNFERFDIALILLSFGGITSSYRASISWNSGSFWIISKKFVISYSSIKLEP